MADGAKIVRDASDAIYATDAGPNHRNLRDLAVLDARVAILHALPDIEDRIKRAVALPGWPVAAQIVSDTCAAIRREIEDVS